MRWFAAEFAVVVSGILVALALQAWYQSRQDAAREGEYLHQLAGDLDVNARGLEKSLAQDSLRMDLNRVVLQAMRRPGPLVPDSARAWLRWNRGWYSDPRPILGTVTTLIQTGDIRLIRDPALRAGIVSYASSMTTDIERLSKNVDRLMQANDAERLRFERDGMPSDIDVYEPDRPAHSKEDGSYTDREVERRLALYSASWRVLRADPELRSIQTIRIMGFGTRVFYLRSMLALTRELRRQLERS